MKNKKIIIATVVVVGVLALLIISGMQGNTGRYLTIQEAIADSQRESGKYIQMEAKVVPTSVKWDPKQPQLVFDITDGKQNINVTFYDVKPDNFDSGYPVIVEGKFTAPGKFLAGKVLVKCPSKYEEEAKKQNQ